MANWKDYQKDWLLFLESGFIAVNQADEDAAAKLFKAAELLKPDSILPKIGMGYLHLHKLEIKQACACFEEALAKEPQNEMAKVLLGIAMSLAPMMVGKGEKVLEQICKSAQDPQIKQLSDQAMAFVDKFVKKSSTPVQGERKRK